jgi:hypothetical protein
MMSETAISKNRKPAASTLPSATRGARMFSACLLLAAVGCASGGQRAESVEFGLVLAEYAELPRHRALATAGDLRTARWVSGIAASGKSREAVASGALAECEKKRFQLRMRATCKLYAVNDVRWAPNENGPSAIPTEPAPQSGP